MHLRKYPRLNSAPRKAFHWFCFFPFLSVSSIRVNSTSRQSFWTLHHSTTNSKEVKFKVKSSNDAILALLTVTNNLKAPHYELTIGAQGNTISQLKAKSVNGEFSVQVDTPQILDSGSFLPFWITWINGTVQFGKGDVVGQNRLLSYMDPLPAYRKDVHAVAVASGGNAFAEWEFQGQATDSKHISVGRFMNRFKEFNILY